MNCRMPFTSLVRKSLGISFVALALTGASTTEAKIAPEAKEHLGCTKDTDCKGDRICEEGVCVSPTKNLCGMSTDSLSGAALGVAATEATGWVKKILKAALLSNMPEVRAHPGIQNAVAMIQFGKRIIAYDPALLERLNTTSRTGWAAVFVLAHEVGHHAEGHTVSGSCKKRYEFEADAFATRVLKRMGASLEEAMAGMKAMPSSGGPCHPATSDRVAAIRDAYLESEAPPPPPSKPKPPPPSEPKPPPPSEPKPPPPPLPTGFPAGTVTLPCGCWGPVRFGAKRMNPSCASGFDVATGCTFACPGGGFQWGAKCG